MINTNSIEKNIYREAVQEGNFKCEALLNYTLLAIPAHRAAIDIIVRRNQY